MSVKNATEIDWLKDSQSFDKVSDLYDQYRPSYPAELIENILALISTPARGQILEQLSRAQQKVRVVPARHQIGESAQKMYGFRGARRLGDNGRIIHQACLLVIRRRTWPARLKTCAQ